MLSLLGEIHELEALLGRSVEWDSRREGLWSRGMSEPGLGSAGKG